MTKSVKLLIAAIALIFSASVIAVILGMKKSDSTCVEVVQNNRIIYRFDLSQEENRTFRVEFPDGGWNDIKIENGYVIAKSIGKKLHGADVTLRLPSVGATHNTIIIPLCTLFEVSAYDYIIL